MEGLYSRMQSLINELAHLKFVVWRAKIESVIYDQRYKNESF